MKLKEAQERFIQSWGVLGSAWGINRTMSQIHALLLTASDPMSAEDIMEALKVSRGNVNMNVRALIEWGLVKKEFVPGERKEYFVADKNIDNVARQIARERRRRELQPIVETMRELKEVKGSDAKTKEFKKVIGDISEFADSVDGLTDKFVRSDRNWFFRVFMKAMK